MADFQGVFDFDALHRQAVDRFENVKRLKNFFEVYGNADGLVYTFTKIGKRVAIGMATDNSLPYNFSVNMFQDCSLCDAEAFFNLMQNSCGKL